MDRKEEEEEEGGGQGSGGILGVDSRCRSRLTEMKMVSKMKVAASHTQF